jgi:glycosyltransferase involved in cell wall biosynthesis
LASVECQFIHPDEVVIVDSSRTHELETVCHEWSYKLPLNHVRISPRLPVGDVYNLGLSAASGTILKIINQDDYLYHPRAIEVTKSFFSDPLVRWLVEPTAHTRDGISIFNELTPQYYPGIAWGGNTVSCESVLAVRAKDALEFDRRLWWRLDVDYYERLGAKYGPPTVGSEVSTIQFLGSHQATNNARRGRWLLDLAIVQTKRACGSYRPAVTH